MGNAVRVSGGGFSFDTNSIGGLWRWKVVANNTIGAEQTFFISDVETPFGALPDVDVPIPGDVIASMADTLSQFQQQLAPLLLLTSSPVMSITVTEGDLVTDVGPATFVNAGAFGSFMSVTATPGTPWMSSSPSSIVGIGKNEGGASNIRVNPKLLLSTASPYSGFLNIQDNRNVPTVVQVQVDVNVLPRPVIAVSAMTIVMNFDTNTQSSDGSRILTVQNSGPATSLLSFKVSKIQNSSPWLVVAPLEGGPIPSGETFDVLLSVNGNCVTLIPGIYSETLRVSSQNASNSQVLVTVTLVVTLIGCSLPQLERQPMRIEDLRFSSSSIDDAFNPPPVRVASNSPRLRIASASQLAGFVRVADDKLVHLSQQDFWKLGKDSEGFYIERLVDDSEGPIDGLAYWV